MNTETIAERSDELLQLLSHSHRRQALRILATTPDNTATIDDLVDQVGPSSEERSLTTEMHHVHLPMMNESDLVEWDTRSGTVRYYPDKLCEKLLSVITRHDVRPPNP